MDARLLDILVCPICKGNLEHRKAEKELVCKPCKLAFPVRDDIPVMLEEEARLLYVALTRAKQKLILAANIKLPARTDLAGLEEKWAKEISAGRLPLLDKMKVAKPLDFLAPALARAKQVKRLGEKAVSDLATGQEGSLVFVHFDPKKDQAQLPDSEAAADSGADLTEDEAAVFKQAEKLYAFSQGG